MLPVAHIGTNRCWLVRARETSTPVVFTWRDQLSSGQSYPRHSPVQGQFCPWTVLSKEQPCSEDSLVRAKSCPGTVLSQDSPVQGTVLSKGQSCPRGSPVQGQSCPRDSPVQRTVLFRSRGQSCLGQSLVQKQSCPRTVLSKGRPGRRGGSVEGMVLSRDCPILGTVPQTVHRRK